MLLVDVVRVEEITDDQIKAPEVIPEIGIEYAFSCKKPGKRRVFNRLNSVCIKALISQSGDMLVTKDFQPSSRISFPESLYCRQRQDEIAERAATND